MKTTAEIVEILRDFKACSGEKYGIVTLSLFGSAARGEQREESEIDDICVKLNPNGYHTLMDRKEDLEELFRTKVDVITLHETMRALFRRNIERDAIYI